MRKSVYVLAAVVIGLQAPSVWAAESEKAAMATPPVMLGQVFLGLLLVVGMILGMAWLLKRMGGGGYAQGKSMKVVAALSLGAREKAVLVQVGDKQMMLGVAPGRVNCLHVFDEPIVPPPTDSEGSHTSGEFAGRFKEVLAQRLSR